MIQNQKLSYDHLFCHLQCDKALRFLVPCYFNSCTLEVWRRWCLVVFLLSVPACLIGLLEQQTRATSTVAHQPCTDAVQDKCNSLAYHKLSAPHQNLGLRQKTKADVEHSKPSASPFLPVAIKHGQGAGWAGHWALTQLLHFPSMKVR